VDNLTHGLCGALAAELWLQFAPRDLRLGSGAHAEARSEGAGGAAGRPLTYFVSIAANNLPDSDLAITGLTEGTLGSLLHHRGHTHTLLGALALALVFWGALWVFARGTVTTRNQWYGLGVLAGIGVLLHLLLDSSNNYGVHPFWPFDNSWYYGDLVFIIEPWWWSVPAACLVSIARTRGARIGLGLVWLIAGTLAWPLPLPVASGVYGSAVALLAALAMAAPWAFGKYIDRGLTSKARVRARVGACLALIAAFHAGQWALRHDAEQHVRTALSAEATPVEILDSVATPGPATPWCWDFLLVGVRGQAQNAHYVVRVARSSALPSWFAAARCPLSRPEPTATLSNVPAAAGPAEVVWDGEYQLSAEGWRGFTADCTAQAFLRFARAPFFAAEQGIVGDLRYDRARDVEFAELRLLPGAPCPKRVPNWDAPRDDVSEALGKKPDSVP
jgi:inner membrane protein